jgi:hypothetical protein
MAQGDHSAGILEQSMRDRNQVVTEYPIPARFLAPKDCTKIPAQLWTLWFFDFYIAISRRISFLKRGCMPFTIWLRKIKHFA